MAKRPKQVSPCRHRSCWGSRGWKFRVQALVSLVSLDGFHFGYSHPFFGWGVLLYGPGWSETLYVDQAILKCTVIFLGAWITDVSYPDPWQSLSVPLHMATPPWMSHPRVSASCRDTRTLSFQTHLASFTSLNVLSPNTVTLEIGVWAQESGGSIILYLIVTN